MAQVAVSITPDWATTSYHAAMEASEPLQVDDLLELGGTARATRSRGDCWGRRSISDFDVVGHVDPLLAQHFSEVGGPCCSPPQEKADSPSALGYI